MVAIPLAQGDNANGDPVEQTTRARGGRELDARASSAQAIRSLANFANGSYEIIFWSNETLDQTHARSREH